MFERKKTLAALGTLATLLSIVAFPTVQAATVTSPTTVVRTVKSYVAPNGKGYAIVLLKNGRYSFKQKGGKISSRTFATSAAAVRYVAGINKKAAASTAATSVAAPVAVPVKTQIQAPATVPTPVYVAPADTSTRAS